MKRLLLIGTLLLSFFSCKRPTEDPTIYYLDPSIDDYVLFPVGSWWVYEEENSGERDTLTVVELYRYIPDADSDIGPYERASLKVSSSYYQNTQRYSSTSSKLGSYTLYYGGGG